MNGFKRFFMAYCIVALLGTLLIIGMAQFVFIPASASGMSSLDALVEGSESVRSLSAKIGDALVFRERKSVEVYPAPAPPVPLEGAPKTAPGSPSPSGAHLSLPRPTHSGPNWGLVSVHEARSFSMKGSARARINAGTVLAVLAEKKTSLGDCLECVAFPLGPAQARFLIRKKDLLMFGGDPSDLPKAAQRLLSEKAKRLADMRKIKDAAEKASLMKNPHYRVHQAARADYIAYWKKVKALQKARDAGQGASQVNAEDQLRQLKGQDIQVGKAYKSTKADYEAWKKANPVDASVNNDPRYSKAREARDSIDAELAALPPAS